VAKRKESNATKKGEAKKNAGPKPKKTMAAAAVNAVQAGTCKISAGFQVNASDMPVTINLCKDTRGTPADPDVELVTVDVYDSTTGTPIPGQPTSLKSNSFTLKLTKGAYDINSTVGPGPGAKPNGKPTVYLYEACNNPTTQLCAFIAGGPGCGFTLTVI
jgi:hypothetical protein